MDITHQWSSVKSTDSRNIVGSNSPVIKELKCLFVLCLGVVQIHPVETCK